ncbi:MAG: riboflavin biosynthesis protein RibF [Candidatus Eiseniibacteriota bacterium]
MIVFRHRDELRDLPGPFGVTVSVFDGVHRGHVAIVRALQRECALDGASAVVVALDPHPLEVLRPEKAPRLLTTAEERVELLARHGAAAVFVFAFSRETAALAPAEFLTRLLPENARLSTLVVGHDFRMGKGRAAGYEELREQGETAGFRVIRVGPEGGEEPVSSTRIRELVAEGAVADAAKLLGHPYLARGVVVKGRGIGRTLDFPTANVDVGDRRKLLPAFGVYAVRVRIAGDPGEARPGALNRGTRPTFDGGEPTMEVHLPGFEGDLIGRTLSIEFVDRIRDERRFDGPEALAARIEVDLREARKILEKHEI